MALPDILKNDGQSVYYLSSCCYSLPYCHIHNHNELLFLLSGRLRLENNLDTVEVDAPAVILHNNYTLHRAELLEGQYERYIINFDNKTLDAVPSVRETVRFFKNANMTVIRLTTEMKEILVHYVSRYPTLSEEDGSRNALVCLMLYEIAGFRSEENTTKLSVSISYINDVMQYISMHYAESFTIRELAEQFYISRAKLVSDFSSTTGMTIKQFTTLVRMNSAREMLSCGTSVNEAAHACGYSSSGNFASVFNRYFGESPAGYRSSFVK